MTTVTANCDKCHKLIEGGIFYGVEPGTHYHEKCYFEDELIEVTKRYFDAKDKHRKFIEHLTLLEEQIAEIKEKLK